MAASQLPDLQPVFWGSWQLLCSDAQRDDQAKYKDSLHRSPPFCSISLILTLRSEFWDRRGRRGSDPHAARHSEAL